MPPSEGHAEDTTDQKYEFLRPVGVFTLEGICKYIPSYGWLAGVRRRFQVCSLLTLKG